MQLSDVLILALIYGTAIYIIYRLRHPKKSKLVEQIRLSKCRNSIDRVYHLKQDAVQVENLITDIQLCKSNRVKAFRISWSDANGEIQEYELFIGENRKTKNLAIKMMMSEREDLTSSLSSEIAKLSERSCKTVFKTIDNTEGNTKNG